MRDVEAEMHKTLDALDGSIAAARGDARRRFPPVPAEKALDTNGRPILADMLCAQANLLVALAGLAGARRDEQGDSGLLGSLIVLVVLAALGTILGLDVVGAFSTAVTWTVGLLGQLGDALSDNGR